MLTAQIKDDICKLVTAHWPDVQAIYLFGSMASGEFTATSDVDLAVLADTALTGEQAFGLKSALSLAVRRDVDLIDLRRCDTVTRALVISTAIVLFAADANALAAFETVAYAQYAHLNEERALIIEDIVASGRIHG